MQASYRHFSSRVADEIEGMENALQRDVLLRYCDHLAEYLDFDEWYYDALYYAFTDPDYLPTRASVRHRAEVLHNFIRVCDVLNLDPRETPFIYGYLRTK